MAAFLVPLDQSGCVIPLEKAILLIGRQADCDVALTSSRKVSRHHCAIAVVNNSVMIRDLGSTNGVSVNGQRVSRVTCISLGDEVAIGDVRFRLQKEPQLATAGRGPAQRTTAPPSMEYPVAIPDGDDDSELPRARNSSKTASDYLDSGPLVPYQVTADDYEPMRSDSI